MLKWLRHILICRALLGRDINYEMTTFFIKQIKYINGWAGYIDVPYIKITEECPACKWKRITRKAM